MFKCVEKFKKIKFLVEVVDLMEHLFHTTLKTKDSLYISTAVL